MKVKKFSKGFMPCAIFSCVLILSGVFAFLTKGINYGLDFAPGLMEEIRIAPAALELEYTGNASVEVKLTKTRLDLVISGVSVDNETRTYNFSDYATVASLADALADVTALSATVCGSPDASTFSIYADSASSARLGSGNVYRLYVPDTESTVTSNEIREVLSEFKVSVKDLGTAEERSFQIRANAEKEEAADVSVEAAVEDGAESEEAPAAEPVEEKTSKGLVDLINETLDAKYGAENVAVVSTDYVSSSLSSSLAVKSVLLAIVTIFLIWVYATIRFHWDFALGAVIALIHDFLIMFTFISWTQVEFSVTTLAAVLTIFGYSINATVVILDRMRENIRFAQSKNFVDIVNKSVSDTFGRSVITTVTTLFAAIALLVFKTGSIHNFAVVLTVGLLSGCYSSMFISSGFISFIRRNWKPEYQGHVHMPKPKKEVTIELD